MNNICINRTEIERMFYATGEEQVALWNRAKEIRNHMCGNRVYIRGVLEMSNYCRCMCKFCGNAAYVRGIERYRMNFEEIIQQIDYAKTLGIDVIHLAAGEDASLDFSLLYQVVKYIIDNNCVPELAVGKLTREQYAQLISLGCKRYILKFETSDNELFKIVKACNTDLFGLLEVIDFLIESGCDVGTGNIVGLPQQTLDSIIDDLLLIRSRKLKMVSTSAFIPNAESAYFDKERGDCNIALNFLALVRLLNPDKNISVPSNSTLGVEGKKYALSYAANELSFNITPYKYCNKYSIYAGKDRYKENYDGLRKIIQDANCMLAKFNEVIYE